MLDVLIADDEALARETILFLLAELSDIGHVREADNGQKALALVDERCPDIVFLDVEMPGANGIDVAKQLPAHVVVIFVTAFSEFAADAFELNAADYLLKPFSNERFYNALQKAKSKHQNNVHESP